LFFFWNQSRTYRCCILYFFQIEKIVLFLLERQGRLASRIEKLGKQRAILAEQPDISGIAELREAYREVGVDLIKLLKFVDLNATGIRKILKKFDKRFSYRFTDYYVTTRSNHPYSQLQQVFKHVVMHCTLIYYAVFFKERVEHPCPHRTQVMGVAPKYPDRCGLTISHVMQICYCRGYLYCINSFIC
jgi:SPX domain protein involved in polyphosphate accumulation